MFRLIPPLPKISAISKVYFHEILFSQQHAEAENVVNIMEETVYFAIPNPVERQTIIYSREGYQQVNNIGVQ